MFDELTTLSRQGASLRPGRAGRSRDHFATHSVRSNLPPLYVPVSPSPVSRESNRDFVAVDRPFDDGRVHTSNVAVSASTLSANTTTDLIIFRAKRPLYLRHISDIDDFIPREPTLPLGKILQNYE